LQQMRRHAVALENCTTRADGGAAAHHRKMLNASRAGCRLPRDEVAELAAYAKSLKAQGRWPLRRLDGKRRGIRSVSALLRPGRRLRTFSTFTPRRWLDSAPLGRSS
jgi:hypothetical protein